MILAGLSVPDKVGLWRGLEPRGLGCSRAICSIYPSPGLPSQVLWEVLAFLRDVLFVALRVRSVHHTVICSAVSCAPLYTQTEERMQKARLAGCPQFQRVQLHGSHQREGDCGP